MCTLVNPAAARISFSDVSVNTRISSVDPSPPWNERFSNTSSEPSRRRFTSTVRPPGEASAYSCKLGKMLGRAPVDSVRHGEQQQPVRLEHAVQIHEGPLDGRRNVLQDLARQDEIVPAGVFPQVFRRGVRDIQARLLMIERVGVLEFFRQPLRQLRRIAHAKAADALEHREIGNRQLDAEDFAREQRDQAAQANRGSARGAARDLPPRRPERAAYMRLRRCYR